MPKRFKYGLNSQTHTGTNFSYLTPLGYYDVVPGDSVYGKVSIRYQSDNSTHLIMNRAFMDVYAFYMPYRLMWDDFPTFLTQQTGTIPSISDLFEWNFETAFVESSSTNMPWFRRMYNAVNSCYFTEEDGNNQDDTKSVHRVLNRASTFHEKVKTSSEIHDDSAIAVDTTAGSFEIRDLAAGLAQQRFDVIRGFYGHKYVDYLRAVGVEGQWDIQNEPELIGQTHHDMKAITITSTADGSGEDTFGQYKTQYRGVLELNLKRRFFPEHGLIGFFAVPKIDAPNEKAVMPAICKQDLGGDLTSTGAGPQLQLPIWWSPELEVGQAKGWHNGIFGGAPSTTDNTYFTEAFSDLQCGSNVSTWDTAGADIAYILNDEGVGVNDYRQAWDGSNGFSGSNGIFEGNFRDLPGQIIKAGFIMTMDNRLTKLSPVHPRPQNKIVRGL